MANRLFTVAAPLPLRLDFIAAELLVHARRTRDASQARRLLALAVIYDGGSRGEAARIGGVGLQIVRDWVVRFNEHGPGGLIRPQGAKSDAATEPGPGQRSGASGRVRPGRRRARRGSLAPYRSRAVGLG